MNGYDEVVKAHAVCVKNLYAARWSDFLKLSGLSIRDDGGNDATTIEDAAKYLTAVEEIAGPVGVVSARMTMQNRARELGLDDGF